MPEYEIPNRAVSYKTVCAGPINQNTEYIEDALNSIDNKASKIDEKIDKTEKGAAGGVATLDGNSKIPSGQIPDEAYSQVFEVNSLEEQLALDANIGDVCKRSDVLRTYILRQLPANTMANWMEISAQGQVIPISTDGIEPYTTTFTTTDWELIPNEARYRLVITESEHNLGLNKELFALLKTEDGHNVYPDYSVDNLGTVTVYSNDVFNGTVVITDLYGNNDPLNCVAYSVNRAMIGSNGEEALFINNGTSLGLNVTQPVMLVDGFNNRYVIDAARETDVSELEDGTYEIFIDTANIEDGSLMSFTFVPTTNYLGVVRRVPSSGSNGQRCYVAYGQSYEYENGGWNLYAFTHVGRVIIADGKITDLYTRPYNQNDVTTNYLSSNKDYLFGDKINGLSLHRYNGHVFTVRAGECLSFDQQKLMLLESDISRHITNPWAWPWTNNAGGLIGELSDTDRFINIFLIGNDYGETDICSSVSETPDLSVTGRFNHYRRIGTVRFYDNHSDIYDFNFQDDGKFYYHGSTINAYTGAFSGGDTTIQMSDFIPRTASYAICTTEYDTSVVSTISSSGTIAVLSGQAITFTVPIQSNNNYQFAIRTNPSTSGTVRVLGFIDKRSLWES